MNPANYTATAEIKISEFIRVENNGGAISNSGYSISPAMDNGLIFNATTGVISGTPTGPAPIKTLYYFCN